MSKFFWQGNELYVKAKLIPKFLWSTASIDVFLNSECILRTGGKMKISGAVRSEFLHNNSLHQAEVSWGVGGLFQFPYQLSIDGEIVNKSYVTIDNWPIGMLTWIILSLLIVKILQILN